jgi:hypothetical protein
MFGQSEEILEKEEEGDEQKMGDYRYPIVGKAEYKAVIGCEGL